ncbi:MAG: hypothetical protein JO303_05145 [Caulobacteraceae bacterium]|nr:hypothetical protein [Caulobacteraceae bacterium]
MNAHRIVDEFDLDGGAGVQPLAQRLAHELQIAAGEAEKCQEAVSDLVQHGGAEGVILRLQALDSLTQHLIELARLLGRMSENGPSQELSALLHDIKLADMKNRLSGAALADRNDGELELW